MAHNLTSVKRSPSIPSDREEYWGSVSLYKLLLLLTQNQADSAMATSTEEY